MRLFDEDKYKKVYSKQDIKNLKFKDNFFDTVICCHIIEHIPDIYSAVNELKRIEKLKSLSLYRNKDFIFIPLIYIFSR